VLGLGEITPSGTVLRLAMEPGDENPVSFRPLIEHAFQCRGKSPA
jgi:hypothetical protein